MMVPYKIKEWCIAITFWQQKNARGVIQLITATIIKTGSGIKAENEFRYPTLALYKEGGFHNFTIHTLYMSNNDKFIPKVGRSQLKKQKWNWFQYTKFKNKKVKIRIIEIATASYVLYSWMTKRHASS